MQNKLKLIIAALLVSASAHAQTIELGHATDTTVARASAGVVSVEGVSVAMVAGNIGAASATTASAGNSSTLVATTAFVDGAIDVLSIDAGAFVTTTTGGAASASVELTTLGAMQDSFDFDAATDEKISVWFTLPDNYVASADIAVTIIWTASTAGDSTDDVIWSVGVRSFANDAPRDTATTFDDSVTDTLLATGDEHVSGPMTGVTIQGTTPTAGQRCVLKISRDADNASDNYGGDAKFLGVRIDF